MNIRIIKDINNFISLKESWNELLKESDNNAVYLTYEWFISWWESFHNSNNLHIVVVIDNYGKIIAIAPLMRMDYSYYGIHLKKICFMANGHSPSAGFIIRRDKITVSIQAILYYLETFLEWDMVELQKLYPEDNTFIHLKNHLKQPKHLFICRDNIESPFILIDSDWETFLNRKSKKFRKVLRNKLNRARKSEDVTIERIPITGNNCDALNDMFLVSGRSWNRNFGTDLVTDKKSKAFYMDICDRLGPNGIITLWILRKRSVPIAFEFHLTYNDIIYPIRAGFDESYRYLSPGSVLEYYILKTLFNESKVKEYNTCADTYKYLMRWTALTRKYTDIELFSKHLQSSFLFFLKNKIRPLLKSLEIKK